MTFLVNDLAAYADYLPTIGATIVRAIQQVPNGRNMLVQHPRVRNWLLDSATMTGSTVLSSHSSTCP